MSPETFLKVAIDPALSVLPASMGGNEVRRFLLAICMQESALKYRRQIGGPARGFPMFEINGVKGVLSHRSSRDIAAGLIDVLEYKGYAQRVPELQAAFEHNDMLALSFARLLIYTLPFKLPTTYQEGWEQYLSAWRPGKPRADTWKGYWIVASAAVGTKA